MKWNGSSYYRFYLPTKNPEDWKKVVGEGKWKMGYSAKALAYAWEEAQGFPPEVREAFRQSSHGLRSTQFLMAFPEHPVHLAGGDNSPSMNDIFVLARDEVGLITIAVEGKVNEGLGQIVAKRMGPNPSQGMKDRLSFLADVLNIDLACLGEIYYQLVHRTASALLEADRFGAKKAVLLIHAFEAPTESYDAFREFVELFKVEAVRNGVSKPININGIELYFMWTDGDNKFLQK